MNATQAENLRILIRHMEGVCVRTLDMGMYFNACGTPACALGEAATLPALAHTGITGARDWLMSDYGHHFHDNRDVHLRLFGSGQTNAWKRQNVTPQEWATEARKVLAENGYSMDDNKAWAEQKVRELATAKPMDAERQIEETARQEFVDTLAYYRAQMIKGK